jgi:type IV secretion system protein VirD4
MFPKERRAAQERLAKIRENISLAERATTRAFVYPALIATLIFAVVERNGCQEGQKYSDGAHFVSDVFWLGFVYPMLWAVGIGGAILFSEITRIMFPPRIDPEPKPMPYGTAHWAEPEELEAHELKPLGAPYDDGVFLGYDDTTGAPLRYQGYNSLITFGPTGSGKLTTCIAPQFATCPTSIIANDPKGEIAAITALYRRKFGKVIVLNPFNVLVDQCPYMKSSGFNPLADLDPTSEEFASDCAMIAEAVILRESKDPHWDDGARIVTAGVIGYACTQAGETRTLARVNEIINLPEAAFKAVMQVMHTSQEDFIKHAAVPYLSEKAAGEKESIINNARTQLGTFMNAKGIQRVLAGDDFRWSDLKKENVTVYIVLPEDKAKAFHRFTRLIYESSLRALLRFPARPVYYVMDELATSLGGEQLTRVETAFNLGRGFGVRLHAFFQNYPQMKTIFKENAASLESAAGVVMYHQTNEEETFKKMQSRAGTWTDWVTTTSSSSGGGTSSSGGANGHGGSSGSSTSHNTSTSEQAFKRDLIDPEIGYEKMGKPSNANGHTAHQILFFEGLASPVWSIRRGYWTDPHIAALFEPNPYKKG